MILTSQLVATLREKTGLPLMKCKKALQDTAGEHVSVDFWLNAAIEHLRKQGEQAVDKMAGRETPCGRVGVRIHKNTGVLVLVGCQTDFVANSDDFKKLVEDVIDCIVAEQLDSLQSLVSNAILKLGENITVIKHSSTNLYDSVPVSYNHDGKIGVIVTGVGNRDKIKQVALHLAANNIETYISRDGVPADVVNKEKEIISSLPDIQTKPEAIRPKIIDGRLNKFYSERVLGEQLMLLDANPKETVKDYCKRNDIVITSFVKFVV